jgi:hypothetical protein
MLHRAFCGPGNVPIDMATDQWRFCGRRVTRVLAPT